MFMPQTWASDNTDLYDRVSIQEGTLSGYPLSTMGAHVSASPGHQSLRVSRIDSRFNIAAFGVLGYELDVTRLSEEEKNAIKDQIAFYKKYRKVFQYGEFRKLRISDNQRFWYTTLGKTTIALEIQTLNEVHTGRNDRRHHSLVINPLLMVRTQRRISSLRFPVRFSERMVLSLVLSSQERNSRTVQGFSVISVPECMS